MTPAVEDYLKVIYGLERSASRASTGAVAKRLGLSASSVTAMLRHLAELGLIEYVPYRGVHLTEAGLAAGLRVTRRHRLVELYLHRCLDVPEERVHDEAERLEHVISPYVEELLNAALGYPDLGLPGAVKADPQDSSK